MSFNTNKYKISFTQIQQFSFGPFFYKPLSLFARNDSYLCDGLACHVTYHPAQMRTTWKRISFSGDDTAHATLQSNRAQGVNRNPELLSHSNYATT